MSIHGFVNYVSQGIGYLAHFLTGAHQAENDSSQVPALDAADAHHIDVREENKPSDYEASLPHLKERCKSIFGKAKADTLPELRFSPEELAELSSIDQRTSYSDENDQAYRLGLEKSFYFKKFEQIEEPCAIVPRYNYRLSDKKVEAALLVKVDDASGDPDPMEAIMIPCGLHHESPTIYYQKRAERYFQGDCGEYVKDLSLGKRRGHLRNETYDSGASYGNYASNIRTRAAEGEPSVSLAKSFR